MKKISNTVLILIFSALLLVDQLTKTIFSKQYIDLGFMAFNPVTNTGMSFGLLQGNNIAFIIVSFIFIALLFIFRKEFENYKILYVMILAGAIGNLVDRIIHGHVLDFIDFKFFPVFNIADSLIFVGVIGIIFLELKHGLNENKSEAVNKKDIKKKS